MNERFSSGYILLSVLLVFLVVSLLAYRSMEYLQERNDAAHGFSEEDALLALPQFRLVDSTGLLLPSLFQPEGQSRLIGGTYVVLAGSFLRKEKAREHLVHVKKKGFPHAELLHFRGDRDIYAIGVGKHTTLEEAREQVAHLQSEFSLEAYVHKVRQRS